MKGLGHGYSRKRAVLAVGAWWLVGCVWIWIAGLTGGAGFERVHPAFEATRTYELQWWPTDLPFGWRNSIPESREPGARGCPGVDVPIYALELMAPVGDFGQDSDCRLESEGFWAGFVQAWRAFYQIVGAVLIAVFGVAMTGLVRKD